MQMGVLRPFIRLEVIFISTETIYQNLLTQLNKLFRHNRQGSYKTKERYYEAMKRFCRYLAEAYHLEKLSNIAPKHIYSYVVHMQEKGLSPSTIKTDLAAIRMFHDRMAEPRYKIPENRVLSLERRSFGKEDRTWSYAEFNKFIGVCWKYGRNDYAAIICLSRYAGLRIHECFRINTAAASKAVSTMVLTVKGKGGKVRTIPINDSIRIELERILTNTPRGHKLFVPEDTKTHIAIKQLQHFIERHRGEVQDPDSSPPLHFHGLRHTYAVEKFKELLDKGFSEDSTKRQLSRLLGHNRPEVTNIYLASLKGKL